MYRVMYSSLFRREYAQICFGHACYLSYVFIRVKQTTNHNTVLRNLFSNLHAFTYTSNIISNNIDHTATTESSYLPRRFSFPFSLSNDGCRHFLYINVRFDRHCIVNISTVIIHHHSYDFQIKGGTVNHLSPINACHINLRFDLFSVHVSRFYSLPN